MSLASIMNRSLIEATPDLDGLTIGEPWRVQTVNLHHVALAKKDRAFADALESATHRTADGWPLVALMRSAGRNVERVTGSDWLYRATTSGALARERVALFGGDAATAAAFGRLIHPGLTMAETGDKGSWNANTAARDMNERRITMAIVAVTPPFGDCFAQQLIEYGYRGSIISVGGSVDMLVGRQRRAPDFVRVMRAEWAWRLLWNPKRLFHRYIIMCVPAFLTVILPEMIRAKRASQ